MCLFQTVCTGQSWISCLSVMCLRKASVIKIWLLAEFSFDALRIYLHFHSLSLLHAKLNIQGILLFILHNRRVLKECSGLKTTSIDSICVLLVNTTSFLARPSVCRNKFTLYMTYDGSLWDKKQNHESFYFLFKESV